MSMSLQQLENFIDRSDFQSFEENLFSQIGEQYTKERYSITYDFISCVNWDYEDLLKFFINNKDKLSVYCIYFYKKYLIVSVDQDQDYPKGEGVEECDIITERLPFWKDKGLEALIRKCKIPQCRKFMKELIGLWNVCFDNGKSASEY